MTETLGAWDRALLLFFNARDYPPAADLFFRVLSDPEYFIVPGIAVLLFVLWRAENRGRVLTLLLIAASALALGDMTSETIKRTVNRGRPSTSVPEVRLVNELAKTPRERERDRRRGGDRSKSFPSGHATNIFAMMGVIAIELRRRRALAGGVLAFAALVAYSRVHLGAHYPFDVLAGSVLGFSIAAGLHFLWRRLEPVAFDGWPPKPRANVFGIAILGWVLLTFYRLAWIVRGDVSLSSDEAQYWDWSRALDWSYYSKPPLATWIMWASTRVLGSTEFGVRAPAVASAAVLSVLAWLMVRRLGGTPRAALIATGAINLAPMMAIGSGMMTTDNPMLLCWMAALWFLVLAVGERRAWAWPVAGLFLGLGLLAKYAAVYLLLATFAYLLWSPRDRALLRTAGPWVFLAVAALVFSPVLRWSAEHGWVNFRHVGDDAGVGTGFRLDLGSFLEFLGSQVGVAPMLLVPLLIPAWSLWRRGLREAPPAEALLWFASAPILLALLLKSLTGKIEANWGATAYVAWPILAGLWWDRWLSAEGTAPRARRWAIGGAAAYAVASITAMLIYFNVHYIDCSIAGHRTRPLVAKALSGMLGWNATAKEIDARIEALGGHDRAFVLTNRYQIASQLAFHMKGQPRTWCVSVGSRLTQHDIWGAPGRDLAGRDAVYLTFLRDKDREAGRVPQLDERIARHFESAEGPAVLEGTWRGETTTHLLVWTLRGYRGTMRTGIDRTAEP